MKLEQKMMLWSDRKAAPGETDSFQPYLTPYLLPGDKVRGCVIVLPGGGYHARAPHEGGVVAERFNSLGFHAFVLEYRVAPYRWPAHRRMRSAPSRLSAPMRTSGKSSPTRLLFSVFPPADTLPVRRALCLTKSKRTTAMNAIPSPRVRTC